MIGSPRFEKLFPKQRLVFLLQKFYLGFNKRIDLFGCESKIHFDRLRTQEGAVFSFSSAIKLKVEDKGGNAQSENRNNRTRFDPLAESNMTHFLPFNNADRHNIGCASNHC